MAMPVKHELTPEELFCLEGCRSYVQYHNMREQFETGTCPFCTVDRMVNTIKWEDGLAQGWAVPEAFMRKELAHHIIITPKRHVRFETELTDAEVLAMHHIKVHLAKFEFEIPGGIVAVRIGDMCLNAGTVPHLHYNIMVPNGTGEVKIPVFKDPKDRAKNQERAEEFARRYEAGEVPD